jgi:hypothetical protein
MNVLTGEAAREYAEEHLEQLTSSRETASVNLHCPDTSVSWTYEPYWQPNVPRLRRR